MLPVQLGDGGRIRVALTAAAVTVLAGRVPALLECWYLGQETGRAVADVLFGDVNPGGKLPITIPRSVGHVPAYYNHKPSARRGYLFDDVSPLYAFGYGLSYTTFAVENVRLEDATIARDGATRVLADVTNTGARAGTEVVQLYVRDRVSSVTRPVKELKGFARVSLADCNQIARRINARPRKRLDYLTPAERYELHTNS